MSVPLTQPPAYHTHDTRRQRGARVESLRFQLAHERSSVLVLQTRADVRSEAPSGARWDDATRKVAKLEQAVRGLEQPVSRTLLPSTKTESALLAAWRAPTCHFSVLGAP